MFTAGRRHCISISSSSWFPWLGKHRSAFSSLLLKLCLFCQWKYSSGPWNLWQWIPGPPMCVHGVKLDFVRANFPSECLDVADTRCNPREWRQNILVSASQSTHPWCSGLIAEWSAHHWHWPEYAWSQSTGSLWPVAWIVTQTNRPLYSSKQITNTANLEANWAINTSTSNHIML